MKISSNADWLREVANDSTILLKSKTIASFESIAKISLHRSFSPTKKREKRNIHRIVTLVSNIWGSRSKGSKEERKENTRGNYLKYLAVGKLLFPRESQWMFDDGGDPQRNRSMHRSTNAGNGESKRLPLPNQASIMPVSYTRGQTAYGGFTIHHMYQHTLVFGRAIRTLR